MDVEEDESGGVADAAVIAVDDLWPLDRLCRVIERINANLADHDFACGETVRGIALNPADHARSRLHSIGQLPVLIADHVEEGRILLLCECQVHLMPEFDTPDDFHNFCDHGML